MSAVLSAQRAHLARMSHLKGERHTLALLQLYRWPRDDHRLRGGRVHLLFEEDVGQVSMLELRNPDEGENNARGELKSRDHTTTKLEDCRPREEIAIKTDC